MALVLITGSCGLVGSESSVFFAKKGFENVIKEWEIEDYHSFTAHFNEKLWLTLHSEFEQVTQLELGVPFKNENEYNWPT